ncbi:MAG: ribosome small subunit-dependent GTPase A [Clostridiales bacterium]|jgi:ribosome biogenesis GTPase|nr:ribosome small subunit-dependent GTPase A [Clostridiales bacterium]
MINLKVYGYELSEEFSDKLIPGRITELHRERYTVITERGEVSATLKGTFFHNAEVRDDLPCVGDFVLLQYNDSGTSLIAKLLPRRTKFSRADFLGHKAGHVKTVYEQLIAVNFDYVFIVTSLNWDFNVNRVVRYLTQTRRSGGEPVIILTKADLIDEYELEEKISEVQSVAPDVPVHAVSSHTGFGMENLNKYLRPEKTVVFLGMSGVGKSSLLNALMQQDVMDVKAIREDDSRGRHTTTHRHLFMLPCGAMVIDTPGMRELGLYDAEEGIRAVFSDVEELFSQCKFSDCRHQSEPGCAIRAALKDGSLSKEQWQRYLNQKRETKFIDDKTAAIREKKKMGMEIAKFSKSRKTRRR